MAKKRAATTTGTTTAAKLAVAAAAAGTQAKAQARSQASDLGDRLAPVVVDARERLAPVVDDARERLVDLTGTVATRIDDLSDTVATRLDDLTGSVATRLDDALPDRMTPAVVKQHVPAPGKPRRLRQALLVLGLGAVAALVTRRLTGGDSQPAWRSVTDEPSPATAYAGAPVTADADRTVVSTTGPAETSVDVAGGTPEEVAADATDTPHPVTTPDQPAQKVILD